MLTVGMDIGSSSVKVALMRHDPAGKGPSVLVGLEHERYRKRNPRQVVERAFERVLAAAKVAAADVKYVATTGEGELAPRKDGHFFGMTTHARGATWLDPRARSVLDIGALHARAMRIDERGRVLAYRMTSQCASGTGQFLENISRYLGVAIEDAGPLSLQADKMEPVSSICAVLAETDIINMVARGIPAPQIFKGIHDSVAGRLTKLLKAAKAEGPIVVTGGMAANVGLLDAIRTRLAADGMKMEVIAPAHPEYAGAIGAAIWGAYRAKKMGTVPAIDETQITPERGPTTDEHEDEPQLKVRAPTRDDLPQLTRIDQAWTGKERGPYLESRLKRAMRPSGISLARVAELHGEIVGFLFGEVTWGEFGRVDGAAWVDTVAVSRTHTRAGVGSALLADFVRHADILGVSSVRTLLEPENEDLTEFLQQHAFSLAKTRVVERPLR